MTPATGTSFVGSERCSSCHQQEYRIWQTSRHAGALQHATPASALGRFDGSAFVKEGIETRFLMRDGQLLFVTQGPGGAVGDFPVKFTLGVEPLQKLVSGDALHWTGIQQTANFM
ncbi:MAG: hypothetical protein JSS04_14000 [Proteobacteria bacterium]|nr:hypothetical protein [Pseudomonadota bacterium]